MITGDAKEERKQSLQERWSEISRRSARRASEDAFQVQRWNVGIEMVNQALLASPALMFPLAVLMTVKLNMLANAYITSIGV